MALGKTVIRLDSYNGVLLSTSPPDTRDFGHYTPR